MACFRQATEIAPKWALVVPYSIHVASGVHSELLAGDEEAEGFHECRLTLASAACYCSRTVAFARPPIHGPIEEDVVGQAGGDSHAGVGHEAPSGGTGVGEFVEESELGNAKGGDDLLLGGGVNDEADHAVNVHGLEASIGYGLRGSFKDKG